MNFKARIFRAFGVHKYGKFDAIKKRDGIPTRQFRQSTTY